MYICMHVAGVAGAIDWDATAGASAFQSQAPLCRLPAADISLPEKRRSTPRKIESTSSLILHCVQIISSSKTWSRRDGETFFRHSLQIDDGPSESSLVV